MDSGRKDYFRCSASIETALSDFRKTLRQFQTCCLTIIKSIIRQLRYSRRNGNRSRSTSLETILSDRCNALIQCYSRRLAIRKSIFTQFLNCRRKSDRRCRAIAKTIISDLCNAFTQYYFSIKLIESLKRKFTDRGRNSYTGRSTLSETKITQCLDTLVKCYIF